MNVCMRKGGWVGLMIAAVLSGSAARGSENVLAFNGSNARVTINHAAHLSALSEITAEIWFKTATARNQMPISKFNNANQEWFIQLRDNGLTVRVGILTTKDFTLPARYDDNAWHHLAMTYDGARIEVFYDGNSLGTQAHTAKILPPQQYGRVQLDPVRIGSGIVDWFVGQLAEARIWNRARSGLKIRADMHRRLPGDLPGLVGYWRLDAGTGTVAADQTPYGVNGTIANATWTTADLDVSGFVVADVRAGGIYYTGSNAVRLARFPLPAGYTHFQITENDDPGTLGAWTSTGAVPATVVFTQPLVNTNVMLYAWFTNTSSTVELMQRESRIVYTDAAPAAAARAALLPYRRLADGGVVTVTGADIDGGSTGGTQDGLALDIAAWAASCAGTPDCDVSPSEPGVSLDQAGSYTLRLIVTNEAGNVAEASATCAVNVIQAEVLYVAAGGDHTAGTSWATALTNVQWDAGLAGVQSLFDFVHDGDSVRLAGGTYTIGPRLEWTQSNLEVRGGYEGVGAPGDQDPAQWPTTLTRDTTITTGIAGQLLGGVAITGVAGGRLDGVTIRDAYNYNAGAWLNSVYTAATSYGTDGANLLIRDSTGVAVSRATFSDGHISANYAPGHGAGAAVVDSEDILLDDCRILRNSTRANRAYTTYFGGIQGIGLYAGNSTLTVTNCRVSANFMTSVEDGWDTRGAGLYAGGGQLRLLDSVVAGNTAQGRGQSTRMNRGGGVAIEGGTHRIWNSLVAMNAIYSTQDTFDSYGDGLYVTDATLSIESSTVAQNSGQGLYSRNSSLGITNSIIWGHHKDLDFVGNPGLFFHSNFGDGTNIGTNACISVDPRFERGFRLAPDSACIDAGGLTVPQAGLTGRTTQAGGTPDTGNVDLGLHWAAGLDPAVADLYVSVGGDDDAAGTPAAPLKTITEALARADHGTRVHIEAGTYSRTSNGESFPLAIEHKFGVELLGTNATATVIDQERPGTGNANQWRVLTLQNTGGGTRIEGLTLTRGWSGHLQYYGTPGGGIGAWYSAFEVDSCILSHNLCAWAAGVGGGLHMDGSMAVLTNTLVTANENSSDWGSHGAGIHVRGDSRLLAVDCRIVGNKTFETSGNTTRGYLYGGGIVIFETGLRWGGNNAFLRCEIADNYFAGKGTPFGAGIASRGGRLLLRNCRITGNAGNPLPEFKLTGGGVYIYSGTARIENCTIADNEAEGLGLFAANNPAIEVVNTIVWGHTGDIGNLPAAAFAYTCASNLTVGVQGNLATNPRFVNAAGGDYRLDGKSAVISPCINAGTRLDWMTGATDLAGEARVMAGRVDLGAYETRPPPGTLLWLR